MCKGHQALRKGTCMHVWILVCKHVCIWALDSDFQHSFVLFPVALSIYVAEL